MELLVHINIFHRDKKWAIIWLVFVCYFFSVDINAQDKIGNTPLHWAVKHNQPKAIDYLIEQGANTTILNEQNMAPLHLACEQDISSAVEVRTWRTSRISICKHAWPHFFQNTK